MCMYQMFFAFLKLRTVSSLPRSPRSSVYETSVEKVSVEALQVQRFAGFAHVALFACQLCACCFLPLWFVFISIRAWCPNVGGSVNRE